ncbi:uncharacterized protein [Antedon mediterranea]|uniref:uncharacterized protein n=1 Tax=Antedon mediterranea TaxID=105859 RepID=UPI003AF87CB6
MFTTMLLINRFMSGKQVNRLVSIEPPKTKPAEPMAPYTLYVLKKNLKKCPAVETNNSFCVFAKAQWPWMSALCYHPNVSSVEGTNDGLAAHVDLLKDQKDYLASKPKELANMAKEHEEHLAKRDVLQGQNAALEAVLNLMDHAMEKKKSAIECEEKRIANIAKELMLTAGKRDTAKYVLDNFKKQLESFEKYFEEKKEEYQKAMAALDEKVDGLFEEDKTQLHRSYSSNSSDLPNLQ